MFSIRTTSWKAISTKLLSIRLIDSKRLNPNLHFSFQDIVVVMDWIWETFQRAELDFFGRKIYSFAKRIIRSSWTEEKCSSILIWPDQLTTTYPMNNQTGVGQRISSTNFTFNQRRVCVFIIIIIWVCRLCWPAFARTQTWRI